MEFLWAAYKECKCEVKVGDMVRESFDVVKGLRQRCVSPVLFSLYINSLVSRLREAGIGVEYVEVIEYQLCCMLMTWSYWQMMRRC